MRPWIAILLMIALLVGLVACASPARQEAAFDMASVESPAMPTAMPASSAFDMTAGGEGDAAYVPEYQDPARKIIYRTDLSMVVSDPEGSTARIREMARDAGGYVAEAYISQYIGDLKRGTVTVRIPVESYEDFLVRLRGMAIRVLYENSNAQDVTAEFTDLEAQLRNLEAAEQELLALLQEVRQRPNAKAQDILEVFNALSQKRGEIEQVKGRIQYLSNLTALSTITITLEPDEATKPVLEEGWQPLVTLKDAFRTLISLLQGLIDLIIRLVVIVLPVLIFLAIPIAVLLAVARWLNRRRRGDKAA